MDNTLINRLDMQTSPYLLQHADNPVHWQPWDAESLAAARALQKPILLSIGYSSCHWCHVMAHESFEDTATAAVMNEHFINIKVDREERPDLDRVYQLAHQILTRNSGGWPLTVFLDPDTLTPFFGGTYFPRTPRFGLPGFVDLLLRIRGFFTEKRQELTAQGDKVKDVLAQLVMEASAATQNDATLIQAARDALGTQYDREYGGFGDAPKFPMPSALTRVLRHWAYTQRRGQRDKDGLDMVMFTLTQMSRGGIFDHLGGGFCRYATDRKWRIPHFEKMLNDNAQLIALFADALAVSPDPLLRATLDETVAWLLREMRHEGGGFFSALDADTEGEEGLFYAWRREQVKRLLTADEYLVIETLYGLDKPANFGNRWVLFRTDSWRSVVSRLSLEPDEAAALLDSARTKLFNARSERIRPACDHKILTSWNGLTIHALATAGRTLQQPEWIDAARATARFLRENLWVNDRLLATWTSGQANHAAYLDDYAFLLQGLASLLAYEWDDATASFSRELCETVLAQFEDKERGGFFFTSHEHEELLYRPKPTLDDAMPPGNGVLAEALITLGHLFAEPRYLTAAERTLACGRAQMEQLPAGHCSMLHALELIASPPDTIVLRGPVELVTEWRDAISPGYKPWQRVYSIPYEGIRSVPAYLPRMVPIESRQTVTAYVCRGLQCSLPISDLDELKKAIGVRAS